MGNQIRMTVFKHLLGTTFFTKFYTVNKLVILLEKKSEIVWRYNTKLKLLSPWKQEQLLFCKLVLSRGQKTRSQENAVGIWKTLFSCQVGVLTQILLWKVNNQFKTLKLVILLNSRRNFFLLQKKVIYLCCSALCLLPSPFG